MKLSDLSDTKWLLPWLVPAGIVFAVLVVAFAPSAVVGALFILVGWVGVPGFYLAYRRTRREQPPKR